MYCVKTKLAIEDTIKKSRFIGIIIPCQSKNEVLQHLSQLQKEHPNASHIVYAYRIKTPKGVVIRFNDAGEPSGTAGKPIYNYMEGKDLINVLCVVVRYFGGIKLGAGGLTRAYGNVAKKTIEACTISKYIEYVEVKLKLDYKELQNFEYQLEKLGGAIVRQEYAEKISLLIKIPKKNKKALLNLEVYTKYRAQQSN